MEGSMNSITRIVALALGLALMLSITPSWGQTPTCHFPGCNPTVSDANSNTAGGSHALGNVDETPTFGGLANTAFGAGALLFNTTGRANTATGMSALNLNTTGFGNTATGASALFLNVTGSFNTASGYQALLNNTGHDNTASGYQALTLNTTGSDNTASGFQALFGNTTGAGNVATGAFALLNNTTGSGNTASGGNALASNTTGNDNTANGINALISNTIGNHNTASGASALSSLATGSLNTAAGFQALSSNTDGANNTAVGAKALKKSLGTKNIGIGYQAGVSLINGNNNIYIGNQGAGDEFQTIRIGTAQSQTFIAGIVTAGVDGATVQVDGNGQLGVVPSSARYKQDIVPMGFRSEKVLDLRPVTFAYKDDARAVTHYGLIAEEVATVYPELVTRTASGGVQTVKYQELIPMLLNEVQRQRHEFQQALQSQQLELAELRALVGQGRGKVVLGGTGE
jgi:hypothetical protein